MHPFRRMAEIAGPFAAAIVVVGGLSVAGCGADDGGRAADTTATTGAPEVTPPPAFDRATWRASWADEDDGLQAAMAAFSDALDAIDADPANARQHTLEAQFASDQIGAAADGLRVALAGDAPLPPELDAVVGPAIFAVVAFGDLGRAFAVCEGDGCDAMFLELRAAGNAALDALDAIDALP